MRLFMPYVWPDGERMDETRVDYADFRIALSVHPETKAAGSRRLYRTTATGPDGREVEGTFINPLEPGEVDDAQSSISAAGRSLQRSVPTDSLDPVRDLGARLYDALFNGSVERAFTRATQPTGAVRVRLELEDPDATAIPWEFLYDRRRNDFLVLSTRTPLVRSVGRQAERPAIFLEPPVRILAVASDVLGTWQVSEEMRILRETLSSPDVRLVTHESATWESFRDEVRRNLPHVVHLIATGMSGGQSLAFRSVTTPHAEPADRAYTSVSAAAFDRLATDNPELCLVVLNGCRTDVMAVHLASSVAGVIGHRGDISDTGAIAFTESLYRALTLGRPLDAAVTAARLGVDSRLPGGREWSAPVLYQRAASVAFPAGPEASSPAFREGSVAPPQDATASHDDRTVRKLQTLLLIQQTNLGALAEQYGRFGDTPPDYVAKQRADLESEITRLRAEIDAVERGPS